MNNQNAARTACRARYGAALASSSKVQNEIRKLEEELAALKREDLRGYRIDQERVAALRAELAQVGETCAPIFAERDAAYAAWCKF